MNVALVIAGGVGKRAQQQIPKQFLTVDEKPIIVYTLEAFQKHKQIDGIVVVCLNGWEKVVEAYCRQYGISKLLGVILGGETRFESMYNGMKYLSSKLVDDDIVLIHDSNRPLVSEPVISNSLEVSSKQGDALAVVPCHDSMFLSDNALTVLDSLDRSKIFKGQTPESLLFSLMRHAFQTAKEKNWGDLPISAILKKLDKKVYFSLGSEENFKITTREDIAIFKAIVSSRKEV